MSDQAPAGETIQKRPRPAAGKPDPAATQNAGRPPIGAKSTPVVPVSAGATGASTRTTSRPAPTPGPRPVGAAPAAIRPASSSARPASGQPRAGAPGPTGLPAAAPHPTGTPSTPAAAPMPGAAPGGAPAGSPFAAKFASFKQGLSSLMGSKPQPQGVAPTPTAGPKPAPAAPTGATQVTRPVGSQPAGVTGPKGPKPQSQAAPRPGVSGVKKPAAQGKLTPTSSRRAHLRITKLDLLAVVKMSFLFAFCVAVVMFVAGFFLWNLLQGTGAISGLEGLLNSVMGNPNGSTSVQLTQYLNTSRVVGFLAGVSVISVFLLTLLGTIFGALYNLASVMFGGIEVTLEV